MKAMSYKIFIFILLLTVSCSQNSEKEKYYDAQKKIVNVKQNIHEIKIDAVEISTFGRPFILNDYLIISDYKSFDKLIHIFNRKTFSYITSVGDRGQGPTEIANMGNIISDKENNTFYVIDHGHQALLSFPMDSVLSNPLYVPSKKAGMNAMEFPFMMQYVNDTLSYGLYMRVLNPGDYTPVVAKWNMLTGETNFMKYTGHEKIQKKRVSFSVSVENNLYAEVYWYHDLITLCTLDGNLKYTLYGSQWDYQKSNKDRYYDAVIFCKNRIVASYLGDIRLAKNTVNRPTKLLVFDLEGNHLITLETGYSILGLCYDEDNNRVIMILDDDIQFAYLDLDDHLIAQAPDCFYLDDRDLFQVFS